MINSLLLIDVSKKDLSQVKNLNRVLHIYCFILFQKNTSKAETIIFINFKKEINILKLAYVAKLVLCMQKTKICMKKLRVVL